ncbi:GIY-YIG nuclease family protein [Paucibacter sp. B2R-40]|uniref:GIY-YIG nuclease family protein n=1 Tax=Paucibacter sp. B2R-40 TaxID=2893554 RepID=UPI00398D3739
MRRARFHKSKGFQTLVGQPGVVYILENDGLRDGWFKIGCSTRSGNARAADLNSDANTGTPGVFRCVYERKTRDCGTAEKEVFAILIEQRRGKWGQEFFHVDLARAKSTIEQVCAAVDRRMTDRPVAPASNLVLQQTSATTASSPQPAQPSKEDSAATNNTALAGGPLPHAQAQVSKSSPNRLRWILGAGIIATLFWLNSGPNTKTPPRHDSTGTLASSPPEIKSPKAVTIGRAEETAKLATNGTSHANSTKAAPGDVAIPSKQQRALEPKHPRELSTPMAQASSAPSLAVELPSGSEIGPTAHLENNRIDLAGLNSVERQSIESACRGKRVVEGPAAYNRCLSNQLGQLDKAPRNVDLTSLNTVERQSIESACRGKRVVEGPAAYNRCLSNQLAQLGIATR